MKQLPLPVRLAAGLAATAVDRARQLPERLTELPITVVSQALQLSMRVQQQVTELAIKGDDVLASFRPVEQTPEWARFDEDEPASDTDDPAAAFTDTTAGLTPSRFDAVTDHAVVDHMASDRVANTSDIEEPRLGRSGVDEVPTMLPSYPQLSLPQLRARLRRLSVEQLATLLDYERAHHDRPEFIGMLTRRIATVREHR